MGTKRQRERLTLSTAPVQAVLPAARLRARSGAAICISGRARARHTSGYVQAADDLRTQSAGSHVLYQIKYGTLSRLISPMPASTGVARGTIGSATGTGDAYGQRARGNDGFQALSGRPAGGYTQLPLAVRRGYATAARGGTDCSAGGCLV
mgnify:CR=1 FL=1